MKKKTTAIITALIMIFSVFALGGCGNDDEYKVPDELKAMHEKYSSAVDTDYGYDSAVFLSENKDFLSSRLGGRNAGSDAEHAAADWLATEMKRMGLQDVSKDAAECDLWSNEGATFSVNGKDYPVYSYATAETAEKSLKGEILYLDKGTMADYKDIDVKGKIVLIDINQRDDWWITYPMLEAQLHGAAAVISANTGGFAENSDNTLNCQDICGPKGIPCLSIGVKDSEEIKAAIEKEKTTGELTVQNTVEEKGTTYNVIGKIKGKSSERQIIIGAHYDQHFYGFQDDSCGTALVLTVAKAMKDSGYKPENDIVFCLHGAKEWGASYTQYDWSIGAYENINKIHPDWSGKTLAFINFELPAYEFGDYTMSYSAPEMYTMIKSFAEKYPLSPEPKGCFAEGIKSEGYQTYTYSDDFSYYAAGVPSLVNGFLFEEDMETVWPFHREIHHSQDDTKDTYNEKVMEFNADYYGTFAIFTDQMPALLLDFNGQYERLEKAAGKKTKALMKEAGINTKAYDDALNELKTAADETKKEAEKINEGYLNAWIKDDRDTMAKYKEEGVKLTGRSLSAFGFAQDKFLKLMYERPIVGHEAAFENITLCRKTIEALKTGKSEEAYNKYARKINNSLEWYEMNFSPEVTKIKDDMFWGEKNKNNLFWGTGKGFAKAEVSEATRSLASKQTEIKNKNSDEMQSGNKDEKKTDFTKEIKIYEKAVKDQMEIFKDLCNREISDIKELSRMI